MTYILGGHCSDGVVLVADRKIILTDNTIEYEDKLFRHDFPIVLGGSGSMDLFDKFRIESYVAAMKYQDNFDWLSYVNDIEDITMKLNTRYGDEKFDVLIAGPINHPEGVVARLYYIPPSGLSKHISTYKVIGSGEPYGSVFLKKYRREGWREKSTQDIAELGYFIIRNIEENELDTLVGLDKTHPQIYYIPNQGAIREASEQELNAIKNKVDVWLNKYNSQVENLFI
jgi:20S proteasome alpha/beta subunit